MKMFKRTNANEFAYFCKCSDEFVVVYRVRLSPVRLEVALDGLMWLEHELADRVLAARGGANSALLGHHVGLVPFGILLLDTNSDIK